jgi:hypothetical protein
MHVEKAIWKLSSTSLKKSWSQWSCYHAAGQHSRIVHRTQAYSNTFAQVPRFSTLHHSVNKEKAAIMQQDSMAESSKELKLTPILLHKYQDLVLCITQSTKKKLLLCSETASRILHWSQAYSNTFAQVPKI